MVKQYEYNSFSLAAKQVRKAHQSFAFLSVSKAVSKAFLSVSKARTNNFYIFLQCTYTVYVTLSEEINLTGTVVSNNCTKIKIKRKKNIFKGYTFIIIMH